jgi:hypothetical protein
MFDNELVHSLGSDEVDLYGRRLGNVAREEEWRDNSILRPINEERFAEDTIVVVKGRGDER